MTDTDRLDRLRGYFHTGEIPVPRPDCLDDETIGELADGTLAGDAREHALAHLASCANCRRAVASVAAAVADGPVTHEIAIADRGGARWRRMWWLAPPLAVAAVLVAVMLQRNKSDQLGSLQLRDSTVMDTSAHVPMLVAPRGPVDRVDQLVWTRVPRADRYRLRLYNAEGDVVWMTETADTVVALPDSVPLSPRVTYLWKVEAQTQWQHWVASRFVEFQLGASSR